MQNLLYPGRMLLCFRHLSESHVLLDALHRRSEFAIMRHADFMYTKNSAVYLYDSRVVISLTRYDK